MSAATYPTPALYRVEFYEDGAWRSRGDFGLLHPEAMLARYEGTGRPVRLTGLDDRLQPAGVVLATSDAPGGAGVRPNRRCAFCGLPHAPGSYEGECLL